MKAFINSTGKLTNRLRGQMAGRVGHAQTRDYCREVPGHSHIHAHVYSRLSALNKIHKLECKIAAPGLTLKLCTDLVFTYSLNHSYAMMHLNTIVQFASKRFTIEQLLLHLPGFAQ